MARHFCHASEYLALFPSWVSRMQLQHNSIYFKQDFSLLFELEEDLMKATVGLYMLCLQQCKKHDSLHPTEAFLRVFMPPGEKNTRWVCALGWQWQLLVPNFMAVSMPRVTCTSPAGLGIDIRDNEWVRNLNGCALHLFLPSMQESKTA